MRKYGRKAIKTDSRTLMLENYYLPSLPAPPPSADWSGPVSNWQMFMNDTLGDCTIAGVMHAIQVYTANTGGQASLSNTDALRYYEAWDGYNPANPSSDQGGIELDVLNSWKKGSFVSAEGQTYKLDAFADVNPLHLGNVRQAINLFGGVYIGMNVPIYIDQNPPDVWQLPVAGDNVGIAGGHAVFVVGYDATSVTFVSWGRLYKMLWPYWKRYVDEVHTLLSANFVFANGLNPHGFNLNQLLADLGQIR